MNSKSWQSRVPLLVRLQDVRRFSVRCTHQKQSVAAHTFNVMWIYMWLREIIGYGGACGAGLLEILVHDLDEALTGDVPAPAKGEGARQYDGWTADRILVKLADKLEQWLFLHRERQLGNTMLSAIEDSTEVTLRRLVRAWNRNRSPHWRLMPRDIHHVLARAVDARVGAEMDQYKDSKGPE